MCRNRPKKAPGCSRRVFLRACAVGGAGLLLASCTSSEPIAPTTSPTPTLISAPCQTRMHMNTSEPPNGIPYELPESERRLKAVARVERIACLAGKDSINQTGEKWGVYGTDLGSMFDMEEKIYLVFGDTFGCCPPGTGGPGSAGDWRYNCMAVTSDRHPADGLTFDSMISDQPGHAKQLLDKIPGNVTIIPTNGVAVGNRMFLHYMSVKKWGDPGKWDLSESGLAFSDDGGQTWEQNSGVRWDGPSNFGQVAFVKKDGDLYLFGIPGGRFGGVRLARVAQDSVLDAAAYRYFGGEEGSEANWCTEESAAKPIVPAPAGELSVMWNTYLGRWIMTYLDEQQAAIVIREAPELWGPWSAATVLVSGRSYPALYGAYMHPWYVENEGESIYFTMSQWGPYSVFWMRADLARN